jgi:hypothetical protein
MASIGRIANKTGTAERLFVAAYEMTADLLDHGCNISSRSVEFLQDRLAGRQTFRAGLGLPRATFGRSTFDHANTF